MGYKWFGRYIQNQELRLTSRFWIQILEIPVFVGGEGFGLHSTGGTPLIAGINQT